MRSDHERLLDIQEAMQNIYKYTKRGVENELPALKIHIEKIIGKSS